MSEVQSSWATPENAARNAATLRGNIISTLQLPENSAAWTPEQKWQYNDRFSTFVLAHPASFTEGHYTVAARFRDDWPDGYHAVPDIPLIDLVTDSIGDTVATVAPKIGTGLLIVAIVGIVAFAWFATRRAPVPAPAP